jgi:glucans biosynthesis protein C
MIVFVVIMHLNVTYSGLGKWYYKEGGRLDSFSSILFGLYASFTQAYFMGLLFFIAGYFAVRSYDEKGFGHFIKARLIRLGIPTLIFMLILNPVTIFLVRNFNNSNPSSKSETYLEYITTFKIMGGSGPLWFALALLIFSMIYALCRFFFEKPQSADIFNVRPAPITNAKILIIIGLMSFSTFLVRLVQPFGAAVFNMQLCFFSQYIILFILGLVAFRINLLVKLPHSLGTTWFKIALCIGIPLWALIMFWGGVFKDTTPFWGGLHWQAVAYAAWESFFCIGVCLGLLTLFRRSYNSQGALTRFISRNAFAVYVFHAPLLVGITLALQEITLYPLLKMLLAIIIVLPISFGFCSFIRRIPFMARLFS